MIKTHNETLLTTTEAAEYLGLKEDTVRKYIQRNLIKVSRRIGVSKLVTIAECDRFTREKRSRGNPHFSRK